MTVTKRVCDCCGRTVGDGEFMSEIQFVDETGNCRNYMVYEFCQECYKLFNDYLWDKRSKIAESLKEETDDGGESR